jgi:hypothetical protein
MICNKLQHNGKGAVIFIFWNQITPFTDNYKKYIPFIHPSKHVLISVIYINNKKANEYYAKFYKFEAYLDK